MSVAVRSNYRRTPLMEGDPHVTKITQVVGSGARRPTRSPSHGLLLFDVDSFVRITAHAEALLGPS